MNYHRDQTARENNSMKDETARAKNGQRPKKPNGGGSVPPVGGAPGGAIRFGGEPG